MSSSNLTPDKKLLLYFVIFLVLFLLPVANQKLHQSLIEAFEMLLDYAKAHVLFCLIPAFFIAGAITVFINQQAVLKYLGPNANKFLSYTIASVSGAILAVCSCTILPLFKGIYKKGAGLGPAVSFLYSGPAINILAIVLSVKVFGAKLGFARIIGAILFAFLIGFLMSIIFKKEDEQRFIDENLFKYQNESKERKLWQQIVYMLVMILILIFMNWAPSKGNIAIWDIIYKFKWYISLFLGLILALILIFWFKKDELSNWLVATRDFALQILPLLCSGILVAGFLLGRPGHTALIPSDIITKLVSGNSLLANFFASISGALMYFATLTEIPILQGLLGSGMGQGPALALLLAGPSLSLPSMIVIWSELGWEKTLTYILLVIIISAFAGFIFGML